MAGPSEAALESALDRLIAAGLVDERDDGLVTTETFESARRVYHDTYVDADADRFRRTVAETFAIPESTAAERIEAGAVTREGLIDTLSLRAVLDDDVDDETLLTMATLVGEITPASPVPDALTELDNGAWQAFLDENPAAVVTVWRRDCTPCDALKADLDAILDAIPEGVAVAGVDGPAVPDFRRTFGVDTAPTVCCFREGDLVTTVTGRESPPTYADAFAEAF